MFGSLKKYKNIIIGVLVVVVLFIGYSLFTDNASKNAGLLSSQSGTQANRGNSDLLVLLINLRSITLDDSIFSDPTFERLTDFGREITPEPTGRNNPFAPVGAE